VVAALLTLCSAIAFSQPAVEAQDANGNFVWPEYSPTIDYYFRDDYPALEEPQEILDDCDGVVGEMTHGWWVARWGANRNPNLTDEAIRQMLIEIDEEFRYYRDVMGWPADRRARNGYKSAVYLFASGLCTDSAPNDTPGGWMGSIFHEGQHWSMILASYYPIQAFAPESRDEWQVGAMYHEGIHAMLADLPGIRKAGWFHEGGNVWFQQTANARRAGSYDSLGWLNVGDLIAPFIPIEAYSGWLTDGSFGGPSAEGVNQYNAEGQQLCNWYPLLGGKQYSSMFPTVMAQLLGDGANTWLWVNAESRVLDGLREGIGEEQTRRLIVEYRSKMALLDLGEWTKAGIDLLNGAFGAQHGVECQPAYQSPPEWKYTPYVATTRSGNTLTPEARTLPGWSGANVIPLTVSGDRASVNFQPIGDNMTCQLAYRTTTGEPVYGQYVSSGECSVNLADPPANGVVFAVVTNTDHIYEGDETRWAKYDYRLELGEGITGQADIHTKWYEAAALDDLTATTFRGSVADPATGRITPASSGYLIDDVATIKAIPAAGYKFDYWSGDITGTNPTATLVMNSDKEAVAHFVPDNEFNEAPEITNPGDRSNWIGDNVNLTVEATDGDGDTITMTATGLPTGLTMSSAGVITGSPTETGTFNVTVNATDGSKAATPVAFTWTVAEAPNNGDNIAPLAQVATTWVSPWESLEAVNDGLVGESSTDRSTPIYGNWTGAGAADENWVEYTWDSPQPLGQSNVYWFTDNGGLLLPDEASLEAWNADTEQWDPLGAVTANPDGWNTNTFEVTTTKIRLKMKSNTESTGLVEWEVLLGESEVTNTAPTINDPGDQASQVGDVVNMTVTATDPDGDDISFTATGLPTGLTMSEAGVVTGSPSEAGTSTVVVTASDGNGGSDQVSFSWTVEDEPVIVDGTNVAPLATVDTSHVSPWESLDAVNDELVGESSTDRSTPIYGNWTEPGAAEDHWVEYTWDTPQRLVESNVYWFTDNAGLLLPDEASLEAWNADTEQWDPLGAVTATPDGWNTNVMDVTTTKIRLNMRSDTESTGLVEWQVIADDDDEVEATCNGVPATVILANGDTPTDGDDVIVGTDGDDVVNGLGGDDLICGGDGDDTLVGADGSDTIYGGPGADVVSGNSGDDMLMGEGGADRVMGGSGADILDGGAGDDVIGGGSGVDVISGGDGDDRIAAGSDADLVVTGGSGNDQMGGGSGDDNLAGGDGDDVVRGGSGDDYVDGGAGDDLVAGNKGVDTCDGGSGGETLGDTAARNCETVLGIP
jgi:hypothetical protein